jgi:hypothetical protein
MEISFNRVVPVLRIFDIAKADEFYQGFLGFTVDWITASILALRSTARFLAGISFCI